MPQRYYAQSKLRDAKELGNEKDVASLDANGNGRACEGLPSIDEVFPPGPPGIEEDCNPIYNGGRGSGC